jgi:hypothetical protein
MIIRIMILMWIAWMVAKQIDKKDSMSNKHQIKNIFLIHNLINGIKQKGFASRATYIYFKRLDS